MVTRVKTKREITAMREGGLMLAKVLETLRGQLSVGMSTKDISVIADRELKALGGQPAFLGYQGYPEPICVSVNEEVVHGIPKANKIIADGDIVSLDFGVLYKGLITDAAITVIVGSPKSDKHVRLIKYTEASLYEGIDVIKNNVRTGDIGYAIESYLNKNGKYGIVQDLVGHGVGHSVHEDPNIPNYGRANTGPWLLKDMTIAVEPMVTLGSGRVRIAPDGWTVLTEDGSMAAHFEHTVLITEDGAEILTALSAENNSAILLPR